MNMFRLDMFQAKLPQILGYVSYPFDPSATHQPPRDVSRARIMRARTFSRSLRPSAVHRSADEVHARLHAVLPLGWSSMAIDAPRVGHPWFSLGGKLRCCLAAFG